MNLLILLHGFLEVPGTALAACDQKLPFYVIRPEMFLVIVFDNFKSLLHECRFLEIIDSFLSKLRVKVIVAKPFYYINRRREVTVTLKFH